MKPRKEGETDENYIRRLEDQNANLKQRNDQLSAWADRVTEAVNTLSCEGSLVFQAMAEKAGVRGHPSVTEAVRLFDYISHPQWKSREEKPAKIVWPEDWDFDASDEQSGDADMALNSPIADAVGMLSNYHFAKDRNRLIADAVGLIQKALKTSIDGIKERNGFVPKFMKPIDAKRYDEMSAEELRDLVSNIGWMALDLAQDMGFANDMLRRDLRAATYRRVAGDLYAISQLTIKWSAPTNFDVKVFSGEAA